MMRGKVDEDKQFYGGIELGNDYLTITNLVNCLTEEELIALKNTIERETPNTYKQVKAVDKFVRGFEFHGGFSEEYQLFGVFYKGKEVVVLSTLLDKTSPIVKKGLINRIDSELEYRKKLNIKSPNGGKGAEEK